MIDGREIEVLSDSDLGMESSVTLHFTYEHDLTLRELADVLDLSCKAINDINRKNGITSTIALSKQYSTKVLAVKEGSAIFVLAVRYAEAIATSMFATYLYDRLKIWGQSSKQRIEQQGMDEDAKRNMPPAKYPISIIVNGGTVDIHIHND